MQYAHGKWRTLLQVGFVAWVFGCASPRLDEVRRTLATYQVGITTFADFRRDADVDLHEPPPPKSRSYLGPPPSFPRGGYYLAAKSSAWRIFEQRQSYSFAHGTNSYGLALVVGDVHEPICILTFHNGTLSEIRPIR